MGTQTNKNYDPRLVGGVTDQGPTRPANQDAFWIPDRATPTELGALYVVADGVGGQEHGAEAARMVTAVLSDVFYRARQHGRSVPAALEEAVQEANLAVFEDAEKREARMGSTVVAAVVDAGEVTVAHVGDARAYLVDGRKLRPLTRDDTWVQNQVDAGLITPELAEKHEFRNVVTQALGNREEVDVHLTTPQPFGPQSALLLCSDGLYDALPPEQLYELIAERSAPAAAKALVEAAIAAQAADNITAVVVQRVLTGPAAGAVPPGGGRPVPLWLILLIGVVVLAGVGVLGGVWLMTRAPDGPSTAATATPGDGAPADGAPAEVPGVGTTATAVTPTAPLPTSTLRPTASPTITATLTATLTPSATPTLPPPLACVITPGQLFVWPDTAMQPGGCQTAVANDALVTGNVVVLLEGGTQLLPIPGDCANTSDFVRVQSETDPAINGWVFLDQIRELAPGDACPPP
ncbi:MAG: serine/threonine-protein phosphatase [Anaerolineales bacterium]|nr:serine/threonine-protein phosphatase [Anaerolineales bacterium]